MGQEETRKSLGAKQLAKKSSSFTLITGSSPGIGGPKRRWEGEKHAKKYRAFELWPCGMPGDGGRQGAENVVLFLER